MIPQNQPIMSHNLKNHNFNNNFNNNSHHNHHHHNNIIPTSSFHENN